MTRQIETGEIVRLTTGGTRVPRKSLAYVLRAHGAVDVLTDAGVALVSSDQVARPRLQPEPFLPKRLWLPYGIWREADGSSVVFSRDYCPMWRSAPDGTVTAVAPWSLIDWVDEEHLYDDTTAPWQNHETEQRLLAILDRMGVRQARPPLADALDVMLTTRTRRVLDAVKRLIPERAVGVNPILTL